MDDALAGMTRRQMEELREQLDVALRSCALDGREGAKHYRIVASDGHTKASILLCLPCFERLREPESRSERSA